MLSAVPSFWDSRYAGEVYSYGVQPNVYVAEVSKKYLSAPAQVVELASGEGRNVAFLAAAGHKVAAVDFSQVALDKSAKLVEQAAPGATTSGRVTHHAADITTWQPAEGPGSVDAVVMSYCHMPPAEKPKMWANILTMLKPGGLLLLECFRPEQISKGYREKSGGPPDASFMYSLQELRDTLGGRGEELESSEVEYELQEGEGHAGLGAVVRMVWRKRE